MLCFPAKTLWSLYSTGNDDPDRPLRIEIPARSVNETYRIIPCGTHGLVVFFRSQEDAGEGRVNWYFTCYDTNFQQLWVKSVPFYYDQEYRFKQWSPDTLSLLFVQGNRSKISENIYEILRIVPQTGTLILNTGTMETGAQVNFFGVRADRAWLGVNSKGQAGRIVTMALKYGTARTFPLGNGSQISILWMQPDSTSVSAIVSRQVTKKRSEYFFVRYDTSGVIRSEVPFASQAGGQAITQVRAADLGGGTVLILGSYSQGLVNSTQKPGSTEGSTGFFSCIISNGMQKSLNFYNFLELQNVSSLVGEEDIMDLQKKALKKNKPLSEYSLDYAVLMHDISYLHDNYLLTADFFSPQYHTESFTDFDFYGRPYTNSYSVFDGYRFFNSVVAGFDRDGRLAWDNNIEIRNLISLELSPKTVSYPSGGDLVLCYISDGKIGSRIFREDRVVEKLDFTAIELLHPEDKLLSEAKGALMHWYANYFVSSGYQEIKNIALESNNKRLVFYFCKLRFD